MEKPLTPDIVEKGQTSEGTYREIFTFALKNAGEYREMHIPAEMVKWYDEKLRGAIVELPLTDGRHTMLKIPTTRLKGHDKDGIIVKVPFYMEGEATSEELVDRLVEESPRIAPSPEYLAENPLGLAKKVIKQYVLSNPSATEVVSTRPPTFSALGNPFAGDIVELARERGTENLLYPTHVQISEAYDTVGHLFMEEEPD